jgi:dethiobiotin synthetase
VRIVVAGTGTGVGKTHVAVALVSVTRGVGLKPIECGPAGVGGTDSERLAAASTTPVSRETGGGQPPYRFDPPVSPHLAARQAGLRIDLGRIRSWVAGHAGAAVVETAGGLFTPLGVGLTNFDLMRALEPAALVLVAPNRLGVLHDLTAALGLARSLGRSPDAVVLSAYDPPDASSATNADELVRLQLAPEITVFPRAHGDAPETIAAATRVLARLRQR